MIQKQYMIGDNILSLIKEIVEESNNERVLHKTNLDENRFLNDLSIDNNPGNIINCISNFIQSKKVDFKDIIIETGPGGVIEINNCIREFRKLFGLNTDIKGIYETIDSYIIPGIASVKIIYNTEFDKSFVKSSNRKIHNPLIGDFKRNSYDFTIIERVEKWEIIT